MNFSAIRNNTAIGKALRFPLRLLPGRLRMPIWQGKLRGKKWIVGSGNHGCWLGSYEYEKQRAFEKMVKSGSVVFDIGAHAGFYTLLAAELVGPSGKVFAFKPVPRNLSFLRSHLEINAVCNVKVIEAAVSDVNGVILFEDGPNSSTGHVVFTGGHGVRSVSLDALVESGDLPMPHFIKIDVEGAEMLVLSGAKLVLERGGPTLFLATHGSDVHYQCCEFLRSLGYRLQAIVGESIDATDEVLAQKSK